MLLTLLNCVIASEAGYTAAESMYFSVHGMQRPPPLQLTPQQTRIAETGLDGLNKLWSLYQNNDIWKVEKSLVITFNIINFLL